MIAHRQYLPDIPPPLQAIEVVDAAIEGYGEHGTNDEVRRAFESYAQSVIDGLERLQLQAWDEGIDFEAALHEIEIEQQRSRQVDGRLERELKDLRSLLSIAMTSAVQKGSPLSMATSSRALQAEIDAQWLLGVNRRVLSAYEDCRENLRAMRESRLALYARTWEDYLAKLDEISPLASAVRRVWSDLRTRLWAPEAAPTAEGFRLAWDRGPHHLQIEMLPDGLVDWFYRNRDEASTQFEENLSLGQPSEGLDAAISRLASA